MDPLDPRHGTLAGYMAHRKADETPCDPCDLARYRYGKALLVDHGHGVRRRVPGTRAAAHVATLRASGLAPRDIAVRANLSPTTIQKLIAGDCVITRTTEQAVLALRPTQTPGPRGYLPRGGVVRRLRALNALGWTCSELARRLNQHRSRLSNLINDQPGRNTYDHVQASTWHAVAALYDELHMTPGPSQAARDKAKRRKWYPPLAFDDIDDLTVGPDVKATTRRAECGTNSGYYRHIRYLKEAACRPCADAHRAYERERLERTEQDAYDEAVVLRILDGDFDIAATAAERREVTARWNDTLAELGRRTGWRVERYTTREDGAA